MEYLEDDASLIEGGIIDSMMILNLLAFLEENFGLSLSPDEFDPEKFETLRHISDMVTQRAP